jgi:GNAT superfamily N-acetyltransferase
MHHFTHRRATPKDLPVLGDLMNLAIAQLQAGFLDPQQVAASYSVMGLDTLLVTDGTYFVVEARGRIAGCGGWSRRATLYGGDKSAVAREPRLLDPAIEAARIRAMYTHPDFARRGVGRLILRLCEADALTAGFSAAQMMATLAGEPLYPAAGYQEIERIEDRVGDVAVPLIRMEKTLAPLRG